MKNELKNLNLKGWNAGKGKWEDSNKDIKKGIYLIHFHPENQIYEVRNISKKPFNKHIIENDEIVLKPGKFINGFKNRVFGGSGYAKYWKYKHEIQGPKRELCDCFAKSTTIYLIADLSNYKCSIFIELVEVYTKLILNIDFDVEKQEKRISEYYRYTDYISNLQKDINSLRTKVEGFIKKNK